MKTTVKLPALAVALILLSGVIFLFLGKWLYASLLFVGGLGCGISALNFKNKQEN